MQVQKCQVVPVSTGTKCKFETGILSPCGRGLSASKNVSGCPGANGDYLQDFEKVEEIRLD